MSAIIKNCPSLTITSGLKPYTVPNGMPLSVFNDRYSRKVNGETQNFADRAREMAIGNCMLDKLIGEDEIEAFARLASSGITPLSGRHLQHGDSTQVDRNIEVFTNCSTTPFSFLEFYLLLNGSGVGRDYSAESCRVDWEYMPNIRLVLDGGPDDDGDVGKGAHADFTSAYQEFDATFDTLKSARHKYDSESEDVRWVKVKDSREGWAGVVATIETAAFHKNHKDSLFVFDFSNVRCKGSPIRGMQDRPAQGPLPLMRALAKIATIKGTKMKAWKQALFIDHYLAACVVMGDVRRCLPGGTLIHLKRGLVPIEDVQVGDMVMTSDGYSGVTENIAQGVQNVITINTTMGQFRCTPTHRVAVLTDFNRYDWKMAKDLLPDDRMVFVDAPIDGVETVLPRWNDTSKRSSLTIPSMSTDVSWFIGMIHGDGRVAAGANVMIPINRDEYFDGILDKVKLGFEAFGFSKLSEQPTSDNCRKFRVIHRQLAEYFHTYFKQPKISLSVPECVKLAKSEIRAAYLAGLLDSDGSVRNRPVTLLCSVYYDFVRQVQAVYSSLGIPTEVKMVSAAIGNSMSEWAINLVGDHAISKFKSIVQPFSVKKVRQSTGVSGHSFGYHADMVKGKDINYRHKWDDTSDQITRECPISCGVDVGKLIPIAVKSVVDEGIAVETFDLSVPDRNEFVAQGLLVHNSARMATKWWKDRDIIEFIDIKRGGFLWSANNSVLVDEEFWQQAKVPSPSYGRRVFEAVVGAAYYDKTGEPGFINVGRMTSNTDGFENITSANYLHKSCNLELHPKTYEMIDNILSILKRSQFPFITNPCLSASTPILTPDGIRTIGDVNEGDKIWGGSSWVKVLKKWSTGIKPVNRYRTTAGVFYGTANHRVLQCGEKIEVSEAVGIDVNVCNDHNSYILPQTVMDGLVIGDGSRHVLSASQVYLDAGPVEREKEYLGSEVGHLIAGKHPTEPARGLIVDTTITPDELPLLPTRIIPDRFVYGTASVATSFLRGLFSANGSCNGSRVTLKTTSATLVEQVQMMLSSVGIVSYYTTNKSKEVEWNNGAYVSKESYDININAYDAIQFKSLIGFIQKHKMDKLDELLQKEPRSVNYQKKTFDIVSVEHISDEEVFDITVDHDEHVYWSGGCLVSNCGEIVLAKYGGYCVIGDVVLSESLSPEMSKLAAAMTAKALIRTNLMPSMYKAEVDRTNRIGVGLTGIFEYAWRHFGLGFMDIIQPYDNLFIDNTLPVNANAMKFWNHIDGLREIVEVTATEYAIKLGMTIPHTFTTIKPSGTISKVMRCTEGAHLPPYAYYLRWVICKKDSEKHYDYIKRGYPVKDVSHAYNGCVVVGFPTRHGITDIVPSSKLVTSYDVTMADQFKWIKLLERFWMGDNKNNQVSYTLKYDGLSHDQFSAMILEWQCQVKCCAVMPHTDKSAYAYLPEECIDCDTYNELMSKISDVVTVEDYSEKELLCEGHACPL